MSKWEGDGYADEQRAALRDLAAASSAEANPVSHSGESSRLSE